MVAIVGCLAIALDMNLFHVAWLYRDLAFLAIIFKEYDCQKP